MLEPIATQNSNAYAWPYFKQIINYSLGHKIEVCTYCVLGKILWPN